MTPAPSFIGRTRELTLLENAYGALGSAFVPIYGRRRVGKSELILHFMQHRPGLYFHGKRAPADQQMQEFLGVAANVLGQPLLSRLSPSGWAEAFKWVWEQRPPGQRFVLALDEFQWMAHASPELPSILQEMWDRQWRDDGSIFLILCGSYMGFMEKEVLGKQSPLFGRRTAQILLQPFEHTEAHLFHPGYSLADAARTNMICGGVPSYLKVFQPDRSVRQNIEEAILDEFGPLHREPDFLLREELREVSHYYGLLMAMASGSATAQALAAQTKIPERSLGYYLNQLIELGYVRRRYPLDGPRPAARRVRFVLADPLLRFWFRFVYPNTSLLRQFGPARTFESRIQPLLQSFFGMGFEELCRKALPGLYARHGVNAAWQVGEYWDRQVQIDVVGYRDDGWTDLGECRWGEIDSRAEVVRELQLKAGKYPNPRNASLGLWVFSGEEEMKQRSDGARWVGLKDLYGR